MSQELVLRIYLKKKIDHTDYLFTNNQLALKKYGLGVEIIYLNKSLIQIIDRSEDYWSCSSISNCFLY